MTKCYVTRSSLCWKFLCQTTSVESVLQLGLSEQILPLTFQFTDSKVIIPVLKFKETVQCWYQTAFLTVAVLSINSYSQGFCCFIEGITNMLSSEQFSLSASSCSSNSLGSQFLILGSREEKNRRPLRVHFCRPQTTSRC